jgi:DNA-binding response OmpR family regulator
MLAALGYEPVAFSNPETALAAARAAPDRFDALIVEQTLPNASGLEFVAELRRAAPGRPIILSSNSPEDIQSDTLVAARIADVLRRPWRSGAVAAALERCLNDQASAQFPARCIG